MTEEKAILKDGKARLVEGAILHPEGAGFLDDRIHHGTGDLAFVRINRKP